MESTSELQHNLDSPQGTKFDAEQQIDPEQWELYLAGQRKPDPEPVDADANPEQDALLKEQLQRLSSAIVHKAPYCQGTIPLPAEASTLFYGRPGNAHAVNLTHASLEELQHLAETCDPATFGVDQKDVYDEAYRKAGKLDSSDFALNFSPERAGVLEAVRAELLVEGRKSTTDSILAELYKLNVYGPGSFFKAHMDTPRSELMLGSLVIVFPTPHEGGALALRESGEGERREWIFDSAALLDGASEPSIAYVAFYSDTEHEVMPVQSGYRVTITYNLYFVKDYAALGGAAPLAHPVGTNEELFRSTLRGLLEDPTFLPEGGNLLFALHHQYPLSTSHKSLEAAKQALRDVASRLKGSDAVILRVIQELSLEASLRIVYQDTGGFSDYTRYVMCDHVVDLENVPEVSDTLSSFLRRKEKGVLLNPDTKRHPWYAEDPDTAQAHWIVSSPWKFNSTHTTYMAYGNQASFEHTYWRISIFVCVGPVGRRETVTAELTTQK
ncbi:hypothetical protein OH77DRAFT_1431338 [Trametes cingulata]|nr:hypothetical protein OH77DRAFT_1431338 [Trametes cingulata]